MNLRCKLLNGSRSLRLDGVPEARRESHRAQHAQFIFSKTQLWLADRADDSSVQILSPTNKIEHFVLEGVQQQAVDGEIAALNVLAGILAEPYLIGMAAVGIADIRTEGCDLDGFSSVSSVVNVRLINHRGH